MEKFLQFSELTVGQRVHRVDNHSADALPRTITKNLIHDWNDVGQAFAGASSGCEDVVPVLSRFPDGLLLVGMESKDLAASCCRSLVPTEDIRTNRLENTFVHEFVDRFARFEGRVELNQWLGPESAPGKTALSEIVDCWVCDPDKTGDIRAILVNKLIAEFKNVHDVFRNCTGLDEFRHSQSPHWQVLHRSGSGKEKQGPFFMDQWSKGTLHLVFVKFGQRVQAISI